MALRLRKDFTIGNDSAKSPQLLIEWISSLKTKETGFGPLPSFSGKRTIFQKSSARLREAPWLKGLPWLGFRLGEWPLPQRKD